MLISSFWIKMRKIQLNGSILLLGLLLSFSKLIGQVEDSIFHPTLVSQHLDILASDSLRGRVNFTVGQIKAADYINQELKSYGLSFLELKSFYHPFILAKELRPRGVTDSVLNNLIAVLPGKSKADEVIIFSAHYDHVDRDIYGNKSGIFNGANDNASGVTAVLMLAKYFSLVKNNERTLFFCFFAGEELGLLGSLAFAPALEPEKVKSVINIEMIGKHDRSGKKAFFLTGEQYSDLSKILKRNLSGTGVKLRSEPEDPTGLFNRSDNYPFFRMGIPAHSIMCSDDKDSCYHQPCDDPQHVDVENMALIIRAIAASTVTLVNGKDSPELKRKPK